MSNAFTDASFEADVLKSDQYVLVDFWAPWCGPCQMMAPIIDELSKEMEGKVKIGKLNVDENQNTAGQFGIMSIPTMLLFKDGKVVEQYVGAMDKDDLKSRLESAIS